MGSDFQNCHITKKGQFSTKLANTSRNKSICKEKKKKPYNCPEEGQTLELLDTQSILNVFNKPKETMSELPEDSERTYSKY